MTYVITSVNDILHRRKQMVAIQQIYGQVTKDGTRLSGARFQSKKLDVGTTIIEFEKPFSSLPTPVCTVTGQTWKGLEISIVILEITPDHFICATSSEQRPIDCAFTFIVFGEE
jgi:hypothetical protein